RDVRVLPREDAPRPYAQHDVASHEDRRALARLGRNVLLRIRAVDAGQLRFVLDRLRFALDDDRVGAVAVVEHEVLPPLEAPRHEHRALLTQLPRLAAPPAPHGPGVRGAGGAGGRTQDPAHAPQPPVDPLPAQVTPGSTPLARHRPESLGGNPLPDALRNTG